MRNLFLPNRLLRFPALATLALAAAAHADYATIEVESISTEVLGTPVAIHRLYARPTNPTMRVVGVSRFQIVVGSALFHHRDFESEGALSTTLGTWNPYQASAAMAAGDTYVILGGSAGSSSGGSIGLANWVDGEFARAQPSFRGESWPGVDWITLNSTQGFADASGRVRLAQFVTRRDDAFVARFNIDLRIGMNTYGPETHFAAFTLGAAADDCPDDASKILPGQCGCGVPDTDSDGDGAADCIDRELAIVQSVDCRAPELFLGNGTAAEIRVDGDRAIVGALNSSAAYGTAAILRRETNKNGQARWVAEARVGGTATQQQGNRRASVAIDGDRVALRVARDSNPMQTVQILERAADGTWPLAQEILPDPATTPVNFSFARGVALAGDWLAIGVTAPWASPPPNQGFVELHRRTDTGWTRSAVLTVPSTFRSQFGRQVGLGDGVLVTTDGADLYVFTQDKAGAWSFSQQITPPDGHSLAQFGESMAFDGDVFVAGCSYLFGGSPHRIGGAVVYRRGADGLFAQEAVLRPEDLVQPLTATLPQSTLGGSVSVSGDVVAVGGSATNRAYVFRRGADGIWRCAHVLARNLADPQQFGYGVALAGGQMLVGAPDAAGPLSMSQPRIDVFDLDPARFGDLDGDGVVGPADLAIVISAWGSANPIADLNGDGVVGGDDLGIVLANWSN
jgi:hypothetical protein